MNAAADSRTGNGDGADVVEISGPVLFAIVSRQPPSGGRFVAANARVANSASSSSVQSSDLLAIWVPILSRAPHLRSRNSEMRSLGTSRLFRWFQK